MGKISQEAKERYSQRVKAYKQQIEALQKREKSVVASLQNDANGGGYKRFALADERLNMAALYLLLNRISLSMLGLKNDNFVREAHRSCYQSLIYLEEVVSTFLDAPFSEYAERLEAIDGMPEDRRYGLIRKLGFTIQSVADDFGENSKWRWSFVELEGRLATVAKNVINLRTVISELDPRVEGYQLRVEHLRLVKELLQKAADRYLERYTVAASRLDDFKMAINFLLALKRLHAILGETQQADVVKRKADVWKSRMDDDEKRAEQRKPPT
ncbi:MAG: hypothetical protein ACOC1U_09760 [Spirochaetota bacterium]